MKRAVSIFCVVFTISQIALALPMVQQERKPRKRVKRPAIKKEDSAYFNNVFNEALIGDRPAPLTKEAIANAKNKAGPAGGSKPTEPTTTEAGAGTWSKIISAEAIQKELKLLSNSMQQYVTSPAKFKSGGKLNETAFLIPRLAINM